MTDHTALYRRLLRREMHSPRSGAAVVVAALLAVMLFASLGLAAWAVWDSQMRSTASAWIEGALTGASNSVVLTAVGAIALIVSILLLVVALTPGRRARHARMTGRIALVVDDGVLADAAADAVARHCGLDRSQVSTTMSRRTLTVRVTPTSGVGVDSDRVAAAANSAVSGAGFDTETVVDVARQGVIA